MPSAMLAPSLRRMIEPLPYSFSIVATASSIALLLFLGSSMTVLGLGRARLGGLAKRVHTGDLFRFQLLSLAGRFRSFAAFCTLAILAALAASCDAPTARDDALRPGGRVLPPWAPLPSDPGAAASPVEKLLGLDRGGTPRRGPPPAPAGDLKAEIDRFTTVEACALERARLDPLVGDALEAIGYDTFFLDAWRLIHAGRAEAR